MSGPDRLSRRRRVGLYVRALEQVLAATPDSSVVLAVENHGRQGNDIHWLQELLAALPTPRVALTLDPANLYWAGYPLAEVYDLSAQFAPRVAHLHAKNLTYPANVRERRRPAGWEYGCCVCPLPEGDVDYPRLLRLLAAAGYPGALAVEDESLAKFPRPSAPICSVSTWGTCGPPSRRGGFRAAVVGDRGPVAARPLTVKLANGRQSRLGSRESRPYGDPHPARLPPVRCPSAASLKHVPASRRLI